MNSGSHMQEEPLPPSLGMQTPWPLQFMGHCACTTEQSAPLNPVWQTHIPLVQVPCPEQFLGQADARLRQSNPCQPALHSQSPPTQLPWPVQLFGQSASPAAWATCSPDA